MDAMPPLLLGRRIAVLGSASGLGLAVAAACEAAGAEVLGIDTNKSFDHLTEFYRIDPDDPLAMDAVAAELPSDLDGLALFPANRDERPEQTLAQGLAAPKRLAEIVAPTLATGGSIVARAAPLTGAWSASLGLVRAAAALRPGSEGNFCAQWSLAQEPGLAARAVGWGMLAWVLSHRWTWAGNGIRVNALTPALFDGRLPPAISAARAIDAADGPRLAAQAAVFLLSPLSAGLTGANLAADGGTSAQIQTSLEGL